MIKFMGKNDGRPYLGLGLSYRNIAKLTENMPIYVNTEEFGSEMDILIIAGRTEDSMVADLNERFPNTPPIDDRRKGEKNG